MIRPDRFFFSRPLGIFLAAAAIVCLFRFTGGFDLCLPLSAADHGSAGRKAIRKIEPNSKMANITRSTVYLLSTSHYSHRKIDDELTKMLFEDYLKTLDSSHIFFTAQDVEEFKSSGSQLGKQIRNGNVQFAFDVFNRLLIRLDEYEKFTIRYLKTNPPLNGNETFQPDRTKAAWPSNRQEQEKIWKKKLRNDLILLELLERSRKDKKVQEKKAAELKSGKAKPAKAELKPRERIIKRVTSFTHYFKNMDAQDVLEMYLSTLTKIYDPHSEYMSPRTEEDFNIHMKLSLVGIGAVLTSEDGYTKIVKIMPGGPADRDKRLKAEDRIIAVTQEQGDPVDIMDMPLNKVVSLIRGEKNTKVTLTILEASKGNSAVPVNITLVRDTVPLKESEVSGKIHELQTPSGKKRIGVITVPSFYMDFAAAYRGEENYKSTTRDVRSQYMEFLKGGVVDALIIDLRTNGGGSLHEAVTMTGLFIKNGPVVQVRNHRGNCKTEEDCDGGYVMYSGPLAVITNRFSASASEIFAGAIKDYGRGIILGDNKTHGKGSVQTIIELDRYASFLGYKNPAGSLRLTNAKFYRINGESTQLRGIVPDIAFPSFTEIMEIGEEKIPHALAWDTIRPVYYQPAEQHLKSILPILQKRSADRIRTNNDFNLLKKDIEIYRKIRDRKNVSLNLEERWKEYLKEQKLQEEQEKFFKQHVDGEKKNEKKDLYLQETLNVMKDWLALRDGTLPAGWSRKGSK